MIALVAGTLAHVGPETAIVETASGVGYELALSGRHLAMLPAAGEEVRIFTLLVHREDAMLLFGFESLEERELFKLLTSVSGIGAKTALAMLGAMTVADIVGAVVAEDARALAKAPGVGKKTAERLVLELREKLAAWAPVALDSHARRTGLPARPALAGIEAEVETALLALGFDPDEIAGALASLPPGADAEGALRESLRKLSGF